MNFHDFIRGVLGLNRNDSEKNLPPKSDDDSYKHFSNSIWQVEDEEVNDDQFREGPRIGFHIFTNPVEIQRYFEQQLDEFMKGIHQGGFGNDSVFGEMGPTLDSFFGGFNNSIFSGPGKFALPPPDDGENSSDDKNLRDLYLKPSYETPKNGEESFRDSDLDGKIDPKAIGEILSRPSDPFSSFAGPFSPDSQPRISSFRQSVISKTIRRPDGTIEIQKTVRDSQGKEETTTSYQKGDQSYTVTVFRDANGEEKQTENFVNIDEDKIPDFKRVIDGSKPRFPPTNSQPILPPTNSQPNDQPGPPAGRADGLSYWFNKFFKN